MFFLIKKKLTAVFNTLKDSASMAWSRDNSLWYVL